MKNLPFFAPLVVACCCVAACSANPGPPPVEDPQEQTSTTSAPPADSAKNKADVIGIGIDPLTRGLNPHLSADDHAFVQALAALVLPSAFVQGEMNTDVLISAEEVEASESGAVQTLRYQIRREAQWSDGTPITGADFRYLWAGMVSTPGAIDPAPYRAIKQIRVSNGGKTVEVDLSERVAQWQVLFNNLLPSHMFNTGTTFEQALATSIPASAGRYMVRSIDRPRGVVTLARNDRFWGAHPAATETLQFREVRTPTHGAEMLRSGQISFADLTPTETSLESLDLLPYTQVRTRDRDSRLELTMSVNSRILSDPELRHALTLLIDVPRVARLAAGRSTNLATADPLEQPSEEERTAARDTVVQAVKTKGPLRLAVDATDQTASAAAITIADLLRAEGIDVETVMGDMKEIAGTQLPRGDADAVISWNRVGSTPQVMASRYACPVVPTTVTASGTIQAPNSTDDANNAGTLMFSGNLSGLCLPDVQRKVAEAMAGTVTESDYTPFFEDIEHRERLRIPLMADRRLDVLGKNIIGPSEDLAQWPTGGQAGAFVTAPTWKSTGSIKAEDE